MAKHVHAELMAQYAQDAMETDKPWKRWELRCSSINIWSPCDFAMLWHDTWEYRRKPKTHSTDTEGSRDDWHEEELSDGGLGGGFY